MDSSAKAGGQFEGIIGGNIGDKNTSLGDKRGIKFKSTLVYLILVSFMAQFLVAPVVSAGVVK
jgi:hypothetical protein